MLLIIRQWPKMTKNYPAQNVNNTNGSYPDKFPLFPREQLLTPVLRGQRGCHGDWERSTRDWTSDSLYQDPTTGNIFGSSPSPASLWQSPTRQCSSG